MYMIIRFLVLPILLYYSKTLWLNFLLYHKYNMVIFIINDYSRIIFIYKLIKVRFTNIVLLKIAYNFYYKMEYLIFILQIHYDFLVTTHKV